MKRISSLILAAAFVLGSMGAAQAVDIKATGYWDFAFGGVGHDSFYNSKDNAINNAADADRNVRNGNTFRARQRARTQINFIASENLQGVLMFEIGTLDWGRTSDKADGSAGGALDADGINIKTKRAYLDWMIPDTGVSVRMGLQGLSLPMATRFSNPVFSADVAGITANYTFDETFAVTAFWARPFNRAYDKKDDLGKSYGNTTDMFGLILPVTLDGVTVTPWGVISRVGSHSGAYEYIIGEHKAATDTKGFSYVENNTATAWWAGLGVSVDIFDPLTFAIDGMYGHLQKQSIYNTTTIASGVVTDTVQDPELGASGWFVTATLDYKLDFATPGLFGWWSTGDTTKGLNAGKIGRIPVVGTDDGFDATSFGLAGNTALTSGSNVSGTGAGTWGVGAQLADLTFIDNLSHIIRVAYIAGTNHAEVVKNDLATKYAADGLYLTDEDHALEVNVISQYQIYENLAATLDLGYINLHLDDTTWGKTTLANTSDAWKAQVVFRYSF